MNHRSGWPRHPGDRKEQGSALLAVLGVSAVLAVLGFSMSSSVGGALDKVALQLDTTQAYYLSQGGIQAAMQEMSFEAGARSQLPTGRQVRRYRFKSGNVEVEIVSEAGKLGINQVSQDVFSQLLIRMGVPTQKAEILASSVIDYRKKLQQGNSQDYQLNSMFSSRASPRNYSAAIQEVEELLALPGFTEDIVYGTTKRVGPTDPDSLNSDSRKSVLLHTKGLLRFLKTQPVVSLDINAAAREVLSAAGIPDPLVELIEKIRSERPLRAGDPVLNELTRHNPLIPLGVDNNPDGWIMIATTKLKETSSERAVSAIVTRGPSRGGALFQIARWYEHPI